MLGVAAVFLPAQRAFPVWVWFFIVWLSFRVAQTTGHSAWNCSSPPWLNAHPHQWRGGLGNLFDLGQSRPRLAFDIWKQWIQLPICGPKGLFALEGVRRYFACGGVSLGGPPSDFSGVENLAPGLIQKREFRQGRRSVSSSSSAADLWSEEAGGG